MEAAIGQCGKVGDKVARSEDMSAGLDGRAKVSRTDEKFPKV